MRLLLDTHVAIWLTSQPSLIPESVKSHVLDESNEIFVSAVSIWEISIKHKTGRRDTPPIDAVEALQNFKASGYQLLSVTPEHGAAVESLTLHHRDPFDNMLVAQAKLEPMHLVSNDAMIALYDCPRLPWE